METYRVHAGDTLGAIARRTGSSVSAIARANGISNPNLIQVGQTLTIPGDSLQLSNEARAPHRTARSAPAANASQAPRSRSGSTWDLADEMGHKYGVSPRLVHAVIKAESEGNPRAHSSAGAIGLMQLMPSTARSLGARNPWDPRENVAAGTKYLRQLLDQFGGDTRLAVAAYNAGPGAVESHGGVPPYRETRAYVHKVLGNLEA